MTGFSSHWLALREPVDHASRSMAVRTAMLTELRRLHGRSLSQLQVVDLGCGSGSNLRAVAPLLGREQSWQLLDHDEGLLDAARHAIASWSDQVVSDTSSAFCVRKGTCEIHIEFCKADLNQEVKRWVHRDGVSLVTASALFDLVSQQWLDHFMNELDCPLYAALTYDGRMEWSPVHPLDAMVTEAFNVHQMTDKGFGAAAGPKAVDIMGHLAQQRGHSVTRGDSSWHLGPGDTSLHHQLLQGIASAAVQTGMVGAPDANDWLAARMDAVSVRIGHTDLFIAPAMSEGP